MKYFLGLGSNLGQRAVNLAEALVRLARIAGLRLCRVSSVYETEPVGITEQPRFLNMVVEIGADLHPEKLMAELLRVEQAMGRVRDIRWGPRLIDLDLLLWDGPPLVGQQVELPHPRLMERSFVLIPLAEIVPGLVLPDGRQACEAAPSDPGVVLVGPLSSVVRREMAGG
ncbi:MAG: 2-amino-4-hydroxy-6-hydroxymethyldihydropteridine diphosphokinase [Armatimonadetes bacterium]|nr:2-amino-4-hydroxy-6-hydroxymethyldihydropteridine diphosphokinase [Armatimonadota bacterium]